MLVVDKKGKPTFSKDRVSSMCSRETSKSDCCVQLATCNYKQCMRDAKSQLLKYKSGQTRSSPAESAKVCHKVFSKERHNCYTSFKVSSEKTTQGWWSPDTTLVDRADPAFDDDIGESLRFDKDTGAKFDWFSSVAEKEKFVSNAFRPVGFKKPEPPRGSYPSERYMMPRRLQTGSTQANDGCISATMGCPRIYALATPQCHQHTGPLHSSPTARLPPQTSCIPPHRHHNPSCRAQCAALTLRPCASIAIGLQEMIWNLGAEFYATSVISGTAEDVETDTRVCVCCQMHVYVSDELIKKRHNQDYDVCAEIGGIGTEKFDSFLAGLGVNSIETFKADADNWNALVDAAEDVVVDAENQDECASRHLAHVQLLTTVHPPLSTLMHLPRCSIASGSAPPSPPPVCQVRR